MTDRTRTWTAADQAELDRIDKMRELGMPNPHTGPFPKTTTHAKHQSMCGDCGEFAAQIIWKDLLHNSDTWFFASCDVCETELCADCVMVDDEEEGTNICQCCFEQRLHKEDSK